MAAAPLPPSAPAPAPETPPLSEAARLVNTFIAPSKTFTDLRRNAGWWAPFLLLIIASTLFSYGVGQKIGFRKAAENVLETRPKQLDRIQQMPADQREDIMAKVAKQTQIGTYGFPVIDLILLLIVSGVLLATFKFAANASVPFKTVLAITMYASLPGVLKFLLATLTLYLGINPEGFNVQNPIATNLGVIFNPTENPVLYAAGSMIDIFAIWTLALTAIGFTCVSKVKRGTAFGIVFSWYAVFMLFMVGLTALVS
jgi:hypothetical protein